MPQRKVLGIVGAGSVGQALARLLAPHFELLIASLRNAENAAAFAGGGARAVTPKALAGACECVLIAVPDSHVPPVAASLVGDGARIVLQTCGGLGPASMGARLDPGVSCATFHPLQTFPTPQAGVKKLPGSFVGVCGDGEALAWCERLACVLEATLVRITEDRMPMYHAAAVLASNCTVGLVDAAVALLEDAGMERAAAREALRPLMVASLENALTMESEQALTGPISRGDAVTVRRHLDAMRNLPAPLAELYRAFGLYLLPLALRGGLGTDAATEVRSALAKEH